MSDLAAGHGEDLDDGCRATTPDGDNLLLDFARTEALAFQALVRAGGGVVEVDDGLGLHLCDLAVGTPFGNLVVVGRPLADDEGPAAVERIRSFFGERAGGPYLVFSPWRTGDWRPTGLAPVGHPPLMFRPPGTAERAAAGLEIVPADDNDTLADFERTLVEAYPAPEMQPWVRGAFLDPAALDTDWRFLVGYLDGDAVATAAAYVGPAVTTVELVSTRPEARGRGVGAALTLAASTARPEQPAMLISSDDGNGVYRSLGYLPLCRYTLWLGTR